MAQYKNKLYWIVLISFISLKSGQHFCQELPIVPQNTTSFLLANITWDKSHKTTLYTKYIVHKSKYVTACWTEQFWFQYFILLTILSYFSSKIPLDL